MAKESKKGAALAPPAQRVDPVSAETKPAAAKPGPVWAYPNRSRCPHCGRLNTKAYASHDGVQSRRCEEPDCRWTYKVAGKII